MGLFAAIGLGVTLYEGITGAGKNRQHGRRQKANVQDQMRRIGEQREQINELGKLRKEFATNVYGNQVKSLMDRVNEGLFKSNEAANAATQKAGMAFSGTVERNQAVNDKFARRSFSNSQDSLYDRFTEDKLSIDQGVARDQANLDVKMSELKGQEKMFDQQSKQKFLGLF